MASNDKPTGSTKITGVVHTLLEGLHAMSKTETLMGQPYTLGDATIVPIHRLRVALGAGAVHGGAKQDASSGESGALGAGGVLKIEPVAVVTVGRDGIPRIMCVESEPNATEKLLEQLPDILGRTAKLLADRGLPILSRFLPGTSAALQAAQPSAPSAPGQLASKPDASSGDGDAGACS